jgi:hypothetical protein
MYIFQQSCALKNNSLNSQHETRLAKENKRSAARRARQVFCRRGIKISEHKKSDLNGCTINNNSVAYKVSERHILGSRLVKNLSAPDEWPMATGGTLQRAHSATQVFGRRVNAKGRATGFRHIGAQRDLDKLRAAFRSGSNKNCTSNFCQWSGE